MDTPATNEELVAFYQDTHCNDTLMVLWEKNQGLMRTMFLKILSLYFKNPSFTLSVKDATQDAFLHFLRAAHTYEVENDTEASFATFLTRVYKNSIKATIRQYRIIRYPQDWFEDYSSTTEGKRKIQRLALAATSPLLRLDTMEESELDTHELCDHECPSMSLEKREEKAYILKLLRRTLSPRQRELWVEYIQFGTLEAVAERLDITRERVRQVLFAGLIRVYRSPTLREYFAKGRYEKLAVRVERYYAGRRKQDARKREKEKKA